MYWDTIHDFLDICHLVAFDRHIHPPEDHLTEDEYVDWLRNGLKVYVLKEYVSKIKKDRWIGTYQIIPKSNTEVYFAGFGVAPKLQRKGYGQVLMDKMIKDHPNQIITCKTRHNNVKMKALLIKNKFVNNLIEIDKGNYWSWWSRKQE